VAALAGPVGRVTWRASGPPHPHIPRQSSPALPTSPSVAFDSKERGPGRGAREGTAVGWGALQPKGGRFSLHWFHGLLTLFPESFATFAHATCLLSSSPQYLALGGPYLPYSRYTLKQRYSVGHLGVKAGLP